MQLSNNSYSMIFSDAISFLNATSVRQSYRRVDDEIVGRVDRSVSC